DTEDTEERQEWRKIWELESAIDDHFYFGAVVNSRKFSSFFFSSVSSVSPVVHIFLVKREDKNG
ncbi:MAG TPA: hypothetical protein VF523_03950, partial [Burkholderiales bacterium]